MANFGECTKCGEYSLFEHKCKPEWEVVCADYLDVDDPGKTFGFDAKLAALRFVEKNFANLDYPEEMEIWVKKHEDTKWQKFDIEVRAEPAFYATQKT